MLTEKKKTVLMIALTVCALLIDMPLLAILLGTDVRGWLFNWLREVGFFYWDWFLVFCFAGSAIAGTLYWKPGSLSLRGIIIFFSIIALVLAVMSFLLLIIPSPI